MVPKRSDVDAEPGLDEDDAEGLGSPLDALADVGGDEKQANVTTK